MGDNSNKDKDKKKSKTSKPAARDTLGSLEQEELLRMTMSKDHWREMYEKVKKDNQDIEERIKEMRHKLKHLASPDRKMDVERAITELQRRGGPYKEADPERKEEVEVDISQELKKETERVEKITKEGAKEKDEKEVKDEVDSKIQKIKDDSNVDNLSKATVAETDPKKAQAA